LIVHGDNPIKFFKINGRIKLPGYTIEGITTGFGVVTHPCIGGFTTMPTCGSGGINDHIKTGIGSQFFKHAFGSG